MPAQREVHESASGRLPRPGDVVAGKYRVDAFIARGGMGAVLAATHQITGRRMALKWLLHDPEQDAEATMRLVREARAAARVRHRNVVDVYDVGEHDGALFLVMELLEGETLHAHLERHGALPPRDALAWLLPVMRGVAAAHQSGVIHRDLKPSNVFLTREPDSSEITPRVLDFGISKLDSPAGDGERSLTRTGAVLGTPHYMAPEQLTGADVDARADVYALGVMLYQCLTGQQPFRERNYNALVLQIANATPTPIRELAPGVPSGLCAVVMRAMARDPGARFATVGALIDALSPFCNEVAALPARGRKPWLITALALALAVGAALWLGWSRSSRESAPPSSTAPTAVPPAPASAKALPAVPPRSEDRSAQAPPTAAEQVGDEPATPQERSRRRTRKRPEATEHAPSTAAVPDVADDAPKPPVPISTEQF